MTTQNDTASQAVRTLISELSSTMPSNDDGLYRSIVVAICEDAVISRAQLVEQLQDSYDKPDNTSIQQVMDALPSDIRNGVFGLRPRELSAVS